MRTCLKLSTLALAVAAATGCASIQTGETMRIVGHQAVRHGGSASDADAQYALGKYYLGQNRAALALIAFTRAIEHDPGHAEAYNGRATALVRLGDLERAGQDVARAIELAPRSAHLLNNQGYIRIQQGDYRGAASSLKQAFEIEPRNERVVANWRLLAARVATDPALARKLEGPAGARASGLASLAPPKPTESVVQSLSKAMSGPVVNLDYPQQPSSNAVSAAGLPASGEASTSVVNLDHAPAAAAVVGTSPLRAAVTEEAAPSTNRGDPPTSAPTQLSVVNLESAQQAPASATTGTSLPVAAIAIAAATPAAATMPAPVATGAVVDVEAVIRRARIDVANGNGVRGMAARVGRQLADQHFRVTRVSNAAHFNHERTRIYFRDGFMDAALQLGRSLPTRPAVMLDNTIAARSDLRVVIGRDLSGHDPVADADDAVPPLAFATAASQSAR